MNKEITLLLLQVAQTVFNAVLFIVLTLIFYKIKDKTVKDVWKKSGIVKPPKGCWIRSLKIVSLAYVFTIAVYVVLKLVNGGMSSELLVEEKSTCSPLILALMILMVGFRSGFPEELFFRGAIGNSFISKYGITKGNLLQSLIFTLPHMLTFIRLPGLESVLLLCNAYVMGLAFGYITYKEKGCTIPAMIWHGIINILAIFITWFVL